MERLIGRTVAALGVAMALAIPAAQAARYGVMHCLVGDEGGLVAVQNVETAPDFTLPNLKGESVSLKSFKGKIVLLDFWASWCPPCRASTPFIKQLHETYAGRGLVVIGINVGEDKATVAEYVQHSGAGYTTLLDESKSVKTAYGVRGIPTFKLVGKDGKILWTQVGYASHIEKDFIEQIEAALK